MANVFKVGCLQIITPASWLDITHDMEERDPPFSLARSDGVGAIQFSVAEFRGGRPPRINLSAITELLADFAQSRELGQSYDAAYRENPLLIAAASFNSCDRFWRVWYCSDGQSVTLVTYNCLTGLEQAELVDCESIVRNLKFLG
jgi:hypothetical protein